eukprot:CFRG3956T1
MNSKIKDTEDVVSLYTFLTSRHYADQTSNDTGGNDEVSFNTFCTDTHLSDTTRKDRTDMTEGEVKGDMNIEQIPCTPGLTETTPATNMNTWQTNKATSMKRAESSSCTINGMLITKEGSLELPAEYAHPTTCLSSGTSKLYRKDTRIGKYLTSGATSLLDHGNESDKSDMFGFEEFLNATSHPNTNDDLMSLGGFLNSSSPRKANELTCSSTTRSKPLFSDTRIYDGNSAEVPTAEDEKVDEQSSLCNGASLAITPPLSVSPCTAGLMVRSTREDVKSVASNKAESLDVISLGAFLNSTIPPSPSSQVSGVFAPRTTTSLRGSDLGTCTDNNNNTQGPNMMTVLYNIRRNTAPHKSNKVNSVFAGKGFDVPKSNRNRKQQNTVRDPLFAKSINSVGNVENKDIEIRDACHTGSERKKVDGNVGRRRAKSTGAGVWKKYMDRSEGKSKKEKQSRNKQTASSLHSITCLDNIKRNQISVNGTTSSSGNEQPTSDIDDMSMFTFLKSEKPSLSQTSIGIEPTCTVINDHAIPHTNMSTYNRARSGSHVSMGELSLESFLAQAPPPGADDHVHPTPRGKMGGMKTERAHHTTIYNDRNENLHCAVSIGTSTNTETTKTCTEVMDSMRKLGDKYASGYNSRCSTGSESCDSQESDSILGLTSMLLSDPLATTALQSDNGTDDHNDELAAHVNTYKPTPRPTGQPQPRLQPKVTKSGSVRRLAKSRVIHRRNATMLDFGSNLAVDSAHQKLELSTPTPESISLHGSFYLNSEAINRTDILAQVDKNRRLDDVAQSRSESPVSKYSITGSSKNIMEYTEIIRPSVETREFSAAAMNNYFFSDVFQRMPEMKGIFTDVVSQGLAITGILSHVIRERYDFNNVRETVKLRQIGAAHEKLGINVRMFTEMGKALLSMIRKFMPLGEYTPDVQVAYTVSYALVSAHMLHGFVMKPQKKKLSHTYRRLYDDILDDTNVKPSFKDYFMRASSVSFDKSLSRGHFLDTQTDGDSASEEQNNRSDISIGANVSMKFSFKNKTFESTRTLFRKKASCVSVYSANESGSDIENSAVRPRTFIAKSRGILDRSSKRTSRMFKRSLTPNLDPPDETSLTGSRQSRTPHLCSNKTSPVLNVSLELDGVNSNKMEVVSVASVDTNPPSSQMRQLSCETISHDSTSSQSRPLSQTESELLSWEENSSLYKPITKWTYVNEIEKEMLSESELGENDTSGSASIRPIASFGE